VVDVCSGRCRWVGGGGRCGFTTTMTSSWTGFRISSTWFRFLGVTAGSEGVVALCRVESGLWERCSGNVSFP